DPQALRAERQRVRRRQPDDAGEEGLVSLVEVALLEIVAHGAHIRAVLSERPRLAREREPVGVDAVVERLDAEAVARAEERTTVGVPDYERPHAVEAVDAPLAPFAIRGEDHLAVRARREGVAFREQLFAQLQVVVDLAVVQELKLAVLHRLEPGVGEIEDRQPQVAEAHAVLCEDAAPVRAAVAELVEPALDGGAGGGPVELDDAAEAAHQSAAVQRRSSQSAAILASRSGRSACIAALISAGSSSASSWSRCSHDSNRRMCGIQSRS